MAPFFRIGEEYAPSIHTRHTHTPSVADGCMSAPSSDDQFSIACRFLRAINTQAEVEVFRAINPWHDTQTPKPRGMRIGPLEFVFGGS